jgi:hypothetical protein
MGADVFHVCYGIRWDIDGSDEVEVERLEVRQDCRVRAARKHGLGHWWGSTADEGRYFLLVGTFIGHFGWEGKTAVVRHGDAELVRVMEKTKRKLQAAGFSEEPAWYFQFEPDR